MLKLIDKTNFDYKYFYYQEYLFQSSKRYYRIVCERKGDCYDVFTNDSKYGQKDYDEPLYLNSRRQKASTIKEAKEIIDTYENEEVM